MSFALAQPGASMLNPPTRDVGLPPAVTPNLPPPVNPNLPPPTGQRYLPGARGPFADPDRKPFVAVPQRFPSSDVVRGTIRGGTSVAQNPPVQLNRINEIAPYLQRCWSVPTGLTQSATLDATIRMSLSRDGRVIGEPRITYVNRAASPAQKDAIVRSMQRAVAVCAPFPLSPQLGNAVAGRIFSIRFI
ncbi:MAG: hypothetical protein ACRCUX_09065, partial [Beijerinckiaceae bacterium]